MDKGPPQKSEAAVMDEAVAGVVSDGTRTALLATGGVTLAVRVALGVVAALFVVLTSLPRSDYTLLALPALLIVPLGVFVGLAACAGAALWPRRWALLYSGTLGCASLDSALCVLACIFSALYVAYATALATGGVSIDDLLASAGAQAAAEANASALAFRVAALVLLVVALLSIGVDFALAYFAAAARYLVDYDVSAGVTLLE